MIKKAVKIVLTVVVAAWFTFNILKDHRQAVHKGLAIKLDQLNSGHLYLYFLEVALSSMVDLQNTEDMRRLARYYSTLSAYLPDQSEPRGLSGFTHYHTGDFKRAYEDYEKAAEIDPEFFWYHHNKAALLAKAGRSDAAVAACKQAADTEPKYVLDKIMTSRQIYFPLVLAGISQRVHSCDGPHCPQPSQYLMDILGKVKAQLATGYKNCENVLFARDNPAEITAMARSWPLAGF